MRRQIENCWSPPISARDAEKLVVDIEIAVNPDTYRAKCRVVDKSRYDQRSVSSAPRPKRPCAPSNPRCSPLAAAGRQIRTMEDTSISPLTRGICAYEQDSIQQFSIQAITRPFIRRLLPDPECWSLTPAFADIHVDIAHSNVEPIPIAIPPFYGATGNAAQFGRDIAAGGE